MSQTPTIDQLLNLVPDAPNNVLAQLQSHPDLASKQDAHGYSLVHAAASYGHENLLKALVQHFKVSPNTKDEDGETALFSVEEVRMAKELLELGLDMNIPNNEGQTAAEKLDDEDDTLHVAAYLREVVAGASNGGHPTWTETATENASPTFSPPSNDVRQVNGQPNDSHPPPPLPDGISQLNVGTMQAAEAGDEPDPEFRRRIEELAAHPDFQGEEGQRQLRNLVTEAITGLTAEGQVPPASRRRLG